MKKLDQRVLNSSEIVFKVDLLCFAFLAGSLRRGAERTGGAANMLNLHLIP